MKMDMNHSHQAQGHAHAHMGSAPVNTAAAAGGTRYTCPMHREIVQDAPGSCPKCGMALVPVAAATAGMAVTAVTGITAGAVATMTPSPQAKTVCNAIRSKGRVINTDPFEMGFQIGATLC